MRRGLLAAAVVLVGNCQCLTPVTEPLEPCNGVDDDGDGLVDRLPDGGLLTEECPLTLGVCAGAKSTCVNGKWTACDYGPDYQFTERRCDGLDNDCDGRVDKSWARVLLDGDAGRTRWLRDGGVALMDWEVWSPQLVVADDGFFLVLPDQLVSLTSDLGARARTVFPERGNNHARLLRDGDHWVRVTYDFDPAGASAPTCYTAHRVWRDGGYPVLEDGGEASFGTQCLDAGYFARFAARDEGTRTMVVALKLRFPVADPTGCQVARLIFEKAGGASQECPDAGYSQRAGFLPEDISPVDGGLVITWSDNQRSQVDRCTWDLSSCQRLIDVGDGGACSVARADPLTVWCQPNVVRSEIAWLDLNPGTPFVLPGGMPLGRADSPRVFACVPLGNAGPPQDALLYASGPDGSALFERLSGTRFQFITVHGVSGPLVLVTWPAESGEFGIPSFGTPFDRFLAEYVCLP